MFGQILAQKALIIKSSFFYLRFYSLNPQLQVIIFAKMGLNTSCLAVSEVENLIHLVMTELGLNPYLTIWIEDQSDYSRSCDRTHYSLITFDWYNQQATNIRKLAIGEPWHLSWLENGVVFSKF